MNREIAEDDIFGRYDTLWGFSYGEGKPTPCSHEATLFADAVCAMLQAKMALEVAQNKDKGYTGQWSASDHYQNEQETFYRACDHLYDLAMKKKSIKVDVVL